MDVRSILLSVEERDKWHRRLEVLKGALSDVRARRQRLERQLKALRRELSHLADISESMVDPRRLRPVNPIHGAEESHLPHR